MLTQATLTQVLQAFPNQRTIQQEHKKMKRNTNVTLPLNTAQECEQVYHICPRKATRNKAFYNTLRW